ncbi:hypothetical protein BV25DRAFT_1819387 [Artomyces pyxidatus]|uniref:Uncharacterized protein n=1 Tax=Artomyces pyxidatus TaxID=48021 RepID=A0ACB8THL8_9AGAM|nr:hypothetical protein BV25DRAFT_1819387 [Artomyces pyxidatus]
MLRLSIADVVPEALSRVGDCLLLDILALMLATLLPYVFLGVRIICAKDWKPSSQTEEQTAMLEP